MQDNLECAEEVLCQYQGFSGIQGDLEHLREEYREWAQRVKEREERQAAEKTLAEIRALAEKQRAVSEKRRAAGRAGGKNPPGVEKILDAPLTRSPGAFRFCLAFL